jgi:hypothetical protein
LLPFIPGLVFTCPGKGDKYNSHSYYTGHKSALSEHDLNTDRKYPMKRSLAGFTVATGASKGFFQRLQNLVASMQHWEPHQRILVFDFGLTPSQLAEVACWTNVEVRPFNFSNYPAHVSDLSNYAWKILAVKDALEAYSPLVWMDSGLEVRNRLDSVRGILSQDGYITAQQHDQVQDLTMEGTTHFLGLDLKAFRKKPFCAGSLQGNKQTQLLTTHLSPSPRIQQPTFSPT